MYLHSYVIYDKLDDFRTVSQVYPYMKSNQSKVKYIQ